jgi:hypothetical protein
MTRLGIALLDGPRYTEDFGCFDPDAERGLGASQLGFFGCPATWNLPTAYAVARGATARATLDGDAAAAAGLAQAIRRLDGVADLIVSDCGFFWGARSAELEADTPLLLSGLDLLPLAATLSDRAIGVLTYSKADAERMLAGHPLAERLRIVGFSEEPSWRPLAPEVCDQPGWNAGQLDRDGLGDDLTRVLAAELDGGALRDAGTLVVECTVIPQFRWRLRQITTLPILDVAAEAMAFLDAHAPRRTHAAG